MIESLQPDAETPRWRQSGRLLRAPDGLQLAEAGEILTAARRRAQELLEEAAAQGERERAQARQEGWLEGRNAAADRHIETVTGSLRYFDLIESSLAGLIAESVRAIMADLPSEERVRQLAAKAVEGLRQQSKLTFRVNPADLEKASPLLAALGSTMSVGAEIVVTSSDEVPDGGVYVESALGIIDASLETQLANLKRCLAPERK